MLEKLSPILPARDIPATQAFGDRLGFHTVYIDTERAALGLPSTGIPRLERAADKPWRMRELAHLDFNGNLIRARQELPLG